MKRMILAAALAASIPAHINAEERREPVTFEFEFGTECEERCYDWWPECLAEVANAMRMCLVVAPGHFCDMLVSGDIRFRCAYQVSQCTRSCNR